MSCVLIAMRRNPANPQKFGALNVTAALGQLIMHHPEVQGQMEQFLMQHVLPEYSSPDGYMRAIVSTAFYVRQPNRSAGLRLARLLAPWRRAISRGSHQT
jgi:hypothetical protein